VSKDYVDKGIDEPDSKGNDDTDSGQMSYLVKLYKDSPESPLVSMYI